MQALPKLPEGADPILRLPAVKMLVGLSTSTIYAWMEDGKFPRGIRIGARARGWPLSTIRDWAKEQKAA